MNCPNCNSGNIKKNGHIHNGKQNHRCRDCGRQFADGSQKKTVSGFEKNIIGKLPVEHISLRGVCRAIDVSLTWLLQFFRRVTDAIPDDLGIEKPEKSRLTLEPDEMRSFAGKKEKQKRIWPAIDRKSGRIVGFHIGNRTRKDAKNSGNPCPVFIVSVQSVILIIGKHMRKLYLNADTEPSGRKPDRQIILKDSTAHSVSAFRDWSEKHFRFPKMRTTISVQSAILFGNSTQHYLCSTTLSELSAPKSAERVYRYYPAPVPDRRSDAAG